MKLRISKVKKIILIVNAGLTVICYALIPVVYKSFATENKEGDAWVFPLVILGASFFVWLMGGVWFSFAGKLLADKFNMPLVKNSASGFGIAAIFFFHTFFIVFSVLWLSGYR